MDGTLTKDLVTSSPLQGGTDNILPGADTDITLSLQVSGDIVATAPILIDATTAVNDILTGADTDRTISINMLGDLATTAPLTGAAADIFPGTNGNKATIAMPAGTTSQSGYIVSTDWTTFNGKMDGALTKDLVTTAPLTGGTDNVFPGADVDITIALPAGTSSQSGYIVSTDWTTFNNKMAGTLLKDLVTTLPLTGGTNDIFPGADADITIAIPVATTSADGYITSTDWTTFNGKMAGTLTGDIVATSPVLIDGTTSVDNILPGADVDRTISISVLKDLVTTAPLQGGTDNILTGTDADVTLSIQVSGDLVTTAPITGGTNDIFIGADTDYTIALTQNLPGINKHIRATIIDPATVYAKDTQVCLVPQTDAALTITALEVTADHDLTTEATGDIKYADTFIGLANSIVINDWDTTAGVRTDSTIASGQVAASKCIYVQFDAAPEASCTMISYDLTYDYDG
jgi:hypothetical protein